MTCPGVAAGGTAVCDLYFLTRKVWRQYSNPQKGFWWVKFKKAKNDTEGQCDFNITHIVCYNWGLRFSSQCCWKSESATIYHYILSQNKIFQWKIGISVKFTIGLGSVKTKKCPETGGIITPEVALLLSLLQIKYLMGFLNYSIKHKS